MAYPKVKFLMIPLKLELGLFYNFLFENTWGWSKYIIKSHPSLEPVLKIKDRKQREAFIKKYVLGYRKKNHRHLLAQMRKDEAAWQKVEERFMDILPQVLETGWPKDTKNIHAMISITPICPRFLDNWSFAIFGGWQSEGMIEVIMHEICHFLYFKKWKEVFPGADRKTFDSPYLEWHLSELLAPVILRDPKIQKILRREADFYEEHQKIKIGKGSAPAFFKNLYKKHLKTKISFGDFLKESYSQIKTHKKSFNF